MKSHLYGQSRAFDFTINILISGTGKRKLRRQIYIKWMPHWQMHCILFVCDNFIIDTLTVVFYTNWWMDMTWLLKKSTDRYLDSITLD